jgi:hypothetical protein
VDKLDLFQTYVIASRVALLSFASSGCIVVTGADFSGYELDSPTWVGDFRDGNYCQWPNVLLTASQAEHQDWGGSNGCEFPGHAPGTDWKGPTDSRLRLHLAHVPAPPSGTPSAWVSRYEIQTGDDPWVGGGDRTETGLNTEQTFSKPFAMGTEWWFRISFWLPNGDPGDRFELVDGDWQIFVALETNATSDKFPLVAPLAVWPESDNPRFLCSRVEVPNGGENAEPVKLLALTTSDGSRPASTYNSWHTLIWGARFSYEGKIGDSSGWLEIWLDGINVYPRKARPTMPPSAKNPYLSVYNTKSGDAMYVGGATSSVLYFADARIGATMAAVGQ